MLNRILLTVLLLFSAASHADNYEYATFVETKYWTSANEVVVDLVFRSPNRRNSGAAQESSLIDAYHAAYTQLLEEIGFDYVDFYGPLSFVQDMKAKGWEVLSYDKKDLVSSLEKKLMEETTAVFRRPLGD